MQTFGEENPSPGNTILYFHGYASSRLEAALFEEEAKELGLRLVAFDRSGYGRSTPDPERTPISAVDDAIAVLDAVLSDRELVYILGSSGGTPYALEVAARLKDRVKRILLFSPFYPVTNQMKLLENMTDKAKATILDARENIMKTKIRLWAMRVLQHLPQSRGFLLRVAGFPEVDIRTATVDYLNKGSKLKSASKEGSRKGTIGAFRDLRCMSTIELPDTKVASIICPVKIWFGEMDIITPPDMARFYNRILPGSTAHAITDMGHFVAFAKGRDALESIL